MASWLNACVLFFQLVLKTLKIWERKKIQDDVKNLEKNPSGWFAKHFGVRRADKSDESPVDTAAQGPTDNGLSDRESGGGGPRWSGSVPEP